MKEISILIPTYNHPCVDLVKALLQQAEALSANFEIIVADDGSTQAETIEANRSISQLPHCRFIARDVNSGRAAIRNFLAEQASLEWLLFIDSDMVVCRPDYVWQYVMSEGGSVFDGGVVIGNTQEGNLRSMYEKAMEQEHTTSMRQQSPYQDFHTANFLVRRDVMLAHPFDLRFRYYGYEDVLFGKEMERYHIPIVHIDNPLSFEVFESNADFVDKTEEGLRTLYQFRSELKGHSRMIARAGMLPHFPIRLWHRLFGKWERCHLVGSHPSLLVFNLYRLGYYISLHQS